MAAKKKADVVVEDGAVYVLRAGTNIFVKTADICAMTGKSNQWVGQLVSQGTISKFSTPHGSMFDITATGRAYCAALEARADAAADRGGDPEAEKQRLKAEVSLKQSRAIKAGLEAKELTGKMHRAEDVADMTSDLIYTMRGMMMALPGRLAIDCANLSDPAEVSVFIRDEVYAMMSELAQYKYDPKRYDERVRERMSWDNPMAKDDSDDI